MNSAINSHGGSEPGLVLRFDPHTIEHLGSNMYSRLPNAVAELVANAYDADAKTISVKIDGSGDSQSIVVADDGHGMSRSDLRDKYLRIGRNRRGANNLASSESGRRMVSGKKGLGKLALFGIGHQIDVRTTREGESVQNLLAMSWGDLITTEDGDYQPHYETAATDPSSHGTSVTVSKLTRVSNISPSQLAESLSRLFHYSDSEVELTVVGRDGSRHSVTRDLRLNSVATEFEWPVPEGLPDSGERLSEQGVTGLIIAAEKPLPTQMRGISVYASGRLANEPEFFGASDSSYAYAYLSGYVVVDALDEIRPDVVATDRRGVNWDHAEAAEVRAVLRTMIEEIAQLRRRLRADKKKR